MACLFYVFLRFQGNKPIRMWCTGNKPTQTEEQVKREWFFFFLVMMSSKPSPAGKWTMNPNLNELDNMNINHANRYTGFSIVST